MASHSQLYEAAGNKEHNKHKRQQEPGKEGSEVKMPRHELAHRLPDSMTAGFHKLLPPQLLYSALAHAVLLHGLNLHVYGVLPESAIQRQAAPGGSSSRARTGGIAAP